jgi:hypothetical protein
MANYILREIVHADGTRVLRQVDLDLEETRIKAEKRAKADVTIARINARNSGKVARTTAQKLESFIDSKFDNLNFEFHKRDSWTTYGEKSRRDNPYYQGRASQLGGY